MGRERIVTMSKKRRRKSKKKNNEQFIAPEARGFIFLACSALLLLSLASFRDGSADANWLGLLGYTVAWLAQYLLGFVSYPFALYFGFLGYQQFKLEPGESRWRQHGFFALSAVSATLLLTIIAEAMGEAAVSPYIYSAYLAKQSLIRAYLGGVPVYALYLSSLQPLLNEVGCVLVGVAGLAVGCVQLFELPLRDWWSQWRSMRSEPSKTTTQVNVSTEEKTTTSTLRALLTRQQDLPQLEIRTTAPEPELEPLAPEEEEEEELPPPPPPAAALPAPAKEKKPETNFFAEVENAEQPSYENFKIPKPALLSQARKVDQSALKRDLKTQAQILEETLESFGIEAKVGQINCGPTITSFEVHPSVGVKVQKIKALEHDIALNLRARSIRIIAPIPGKAAVGIEVPNPQPQEVSFRELLSTYQASGRKFHVPVLLGKTVNGDDVIADLTKMPHLIIAGATGSGKSVCINTIVMSILMNARPDEIRMLMVDPKKVELTPYSKLPHMIAPVITEPGGACTALNWLVKEMETRYELLKAVGVRNIASFNARKRDVAYEESLTIDVPERLPYYVGIIDELADLMMVSSSDIETPIARIAQMARAVGIHLILATQRPSREVITGLIKANFPTRIAFKVSSRINSQIILDEPGAETLLGNGDMLFLPPGSSNLIRAQGAFIRDEDINQVVDRICEQAAPQYLIKSFESIALDMDDEGPDVGEERDALYDQAVQTIVSTGNASTTFLQRKLKIGYARAASIMDQLEVDGVVGPADGAKARQILVSAQPTEE